MLTQPDFRFGLKIFQQTVILKNKLGHEFEIMKLEVDGP